MAIGRICKTLVMRGNREYNRCDAKAKPIENAAKIIIKLLTDAAINKKRHLYRER